MSYKIRSVRAPQLDLGVWANYHGAQFKIAHTSNSNFLRTLARLQAPFRKDIEKNRMDPDQTKDIVAEALATNILKDWAVKDEHGNDVPYTSKIGKVALLSDEGLREFVQEYATDLSNYRDEDIEDKGNS